MSWGGVKKIYVNENNELTYLKCTEKSSNVIVPTQCGSILLPMVSHPNITFYNFKYFSVLKQNFKFLCNQTPE